MSGGWIRYEYVVMGVVLALAALYYLAINNVTAIVIGLALIVIAAILLGVAFRRPPRPVATTVPAP